eukprot:s3118_g12.t1
MHMQKKNHHLLGMLLGTWVFLKTWPMFLETLLMFPHAEEEPPPAGDVAGDMGVSQNLADVPGDLADVPDDLLGDLADVPNDIFGDLGGGVPDACAQSDVEASLPDVPEVSNSHGFVKEGNFEASDEEPESKSVVANTLDVATADGFDLAEPASSSAAAPSIPDALALQDQKSTTRHLLWHKRPLQDAA